MKLRSVRASQGAVWVRAGFQAFFRRPLAFAFLFATFMFAVFATAMVPLVGPLVVLALMPMVCQGFMIATRTVVDGGVPTPRVLLEPLRSARPRVVSMLLLGVGYAAATFAIMWLSDALDGGSLQALREALPEGTSTPDAAAAKLSDPDLAFGLMVRLGLAGALSVPFWHAPALIYWEGHGVAKALFASTLACWRNRAAFTVYGLVWFGLVAALCLLGGLLVAVLGPSQMLSAVAVPLSLVLTTVFYVCLYFTYADCFVRDAPDLPVLLA
jgi:hypothetical protein